MLFIFVRLCKRAFHFVLCFTCCFISFVHKDLWSPIVWKGERAGDLYFVGMESCSYCMHILIFVNSRVKLSASSLQLSYSIKPRLPFSICSVFFVSKDNLFYFYFITDRSKAVVSLQFLIWFSVLCCSYARCIVFVCLCASFTFSFLWWLGMIVMFDCGIS